MLSTKKGKEAYVEPVIEGRGYRFTVKVGKPGDADAAKAGTKLSRGANFKCVMSGANVVNDPYIKAESMAGRMGARLMAMVAEGDRARVYLGPMPEHEAIVRKAKPEWTPDQQMNRDTSNLVSGRGYGFFTWADLFTPRQLVALTTFSDLVTEARARVRRDAIAAGIPDDGRPLREGGTGATAYSEAVGVYLACGVEPPQHYWSVIGTPAEGFIRGTFARQALPMVGTTLRQSFGKTRRNWLAGINWITKALELFPSTEYGSAIQADAATQSILENKLVSTDPLLRQHRLRRPVGFLLRLAAPFPKADLPDLFATLAVPKAEELVATPYRHGNKEKAEAFFLAE